MYLRVRPLDYFERNTPSKKYNHQGCIEILDQYSAMIKSSSEVQQLKNVQVKDTYQFQHIYKPSVTNIEIYTSLIQPTLDQFIDMKSQKLILKGDKNSGRTYTLLGIAQDPGILLIFTQHLQFKLDEIMQKQKSNKYENKYFYKLFLKAYVKDKEYFDLLTGSIQSIITFDNTINFDSQLSFLKLLRIILKNLDSRQFETAKEYHQFQQNQTKYQLGEITIDIILERTQLTWYGTKSSESAHYKFQIENAISQTRLQQKEIIVFTVNPTQKTLAATRAILRFSSQLQWSNITSPDYKSIILNKFQFVLRSVNLITIIDIQKGLTVLIRQFNKECERYIQILQLKQDIMDQTYELVKQDLQIIGKLVISDDVREFLMYKFQLYQIEESQNGCKKLKTEVSALQGKCAKLLQTQPYIRSKLESDNLEFRVYQDIKRNLIDIVSHIRSLVLQDQYRAFPLQELQKFVEQEFLNQIPLAAINEQKTEVTIQSLPRIVNKRAAKSYTVSLANNDTIDSYSMLRTEQESKLLKQPKLLIIKPNKLKQEMFLNYDDGLTSIDRRQFRNESDYKKIKGVIRVSKYSNDRILDDMSQLKTSIVQNSIDSPESIIKEFERRNQQQQCNIILYVEQKILKIPKVSAAYIENILQATNLKHPSCVNSFR